MIYTIFFYKKSHNNTYKQIKTNKMAKSINKFSLTQSYSKMSVWGQILILVLFLLIVIMICNSLFKKGNMNKEGFEQQQTFTNKTKVNDIYDPFYADIYDHLVYNKIKDDYEIGQILNSTKPTRESIILDIGSGTGNHVAALAEKGIKATGLDISSSMINRANKKYPGLNFVQGDAMNSNQFQSQSFTHILCLYHTLYYFKDKAHFFGNAMNWLIPGGSLVIHIVDREMFDPILPAANPLIMLTPQRHAPKRITTSKITFDTFKYESDYQLNRETNQAKAIEKFSNKNTGKTFRRHEHPLYIEPESDILNFAQEAGFIVQGEIDLIKVGYEYNKLIILQKPA